MKGLVQRRSLAIAITRSRGPSCTRKFGGIGRAQGDGLEAEIGTRLGNRFSDEDANEPLFPVGGGGYGHGAPLNSNFAGSGCLAVGDEAAHQNAALQFGKASAGRGSTGYKLGQTGGSISGSAGPLLPDISLGRGSSLQRPSSEDSLFSDRKPSMPTISLGLGGFGRGKTVQTAVPEIHPEESFSGGNRKVLPKWDETIRKIEERDNALRAEELKRFEDKYPVLGYPSPPVAPSLGASVRRSVQVDDFSSRNSQSPGSTFGFPQQSRALDPDRFALREEHIESDQGNSLSQALRSSAVPGWEHKILPDEVASGQGGPPSPQSQHVAAAEPSTLTHQQASPHHLHFSEELELKHVAGQLSRSRFGTADVRSQAPGAGPGLGVPFDNTKGESHYRAATQAGPVTATSKSYDSIPTIPTAIGETYANTAGARGTISGLGTSMSPLYDNTVGKSSFSADKQAATSFPGSPTTMPKSHGTAVGEYDVTRQVPPSFPGFATGTGEPYDNTKGQYYYRSGTQAVPTFPGPAPATPKPHDITNAGRQVPLAFPGLPTARGEPYDNAKGASGTIPGLATSMFKPYDNTTGKSSYSVEKQGAPSLLGSPTAMPKPYDITMEEYDVGRQVPPAFPGFATATGGPYDNTKGESYHRVGTQAVPTFPGPATAMPKPHVPLAFPTARGEPYDNTIGTIPGLATLMSKPYDNTMGKSSYSADKQADPSFLGSPIAVPKSHDSTKGEFAVGRQVPPAFPGFATATGELYDNTKGESYYSVGRQSPSAFPGLAFGSQEAYGSTQGESYYSVGRQASPVFSPSGMAEFQDDVARQAPPKLPPKPSGSGIRESYHGTSWHAAPATPVNSEMDGSFYTASRPPPKPSGSGIRESYLGTSWHAAPAAPVNSEMDGSFYTASRQAAPLKFSASRSEQFQHDTSGQPIDSAFSGMRLAQDVSSMPHKEQLYYEEDWQQAWPTVANSESSQQMPTDFDQTEHWYSDTTITAAQESFPTFDSTQYFSQQTQGQDGHDSGGWQPSWSASASPEYSADNTTPGTNDYNYEWIGQSPDAMGLHHDGNHQVFAEKTPPHPEVGVDYNGRIEECFAQGKLEDIDAVYEEMKASQVQASPKTYDTLMQTFMKLGKTEKMSQVYQEMREVIMPSYVKQTGIKEDTMTTAVKDNKKPATPSVAERTGQSGHGASKEMPCSEDDVQKMDYKKPATPAVAEGTGQSGYGASKEMLHSVDEVQNKDNTEQQNRQAYDQGGHGTSTDHQSMHSDENLKGFLPLGMQRSSAGVGTGRGKKVSSFDFAGSQCLGLGRGYPQPDLETKPAKSDDYSETFRPVIRPELQYAFAPEGLSGGPGAGRGRPLSPQSPDTSTGRGRPLSLQTHDSLGVGRGRLPSPQAFDSTIGGRILHPQHVDGGVETQQPFYAEDMESEFQQHDSQDQFRPALSREKAGDRAMQILDERLNRKLRRMEEWSRYDDDDSVSVRRLPVRMPQARARKERRQLIKLPEQEEEPQLTEEQSKEEIARARAMEKNEEIEKLQHTLSQFMKNYGEMGLELEYLMGDFMTNPDIEEKRLPPLEEYLEKAKPNIMKTGIIRSEREWQRMVRDVLRNVSYFEELVEEYSGPGRYTAKQENEDLEAIAKTLPSDVGPKFQSSIQRCLATLKSNPGFNLDEKQWMLSNMVDEFFELSQYEDRWETVSSRAVS